MPLLLFICGFSWIGLLVNRNDGTMENIGWWIGAILTSLLLWYGYRLKNKKEKTEVVVMLTNEKHGTSFSDDFGAYYEDAGIFVDIKSNKVLVVDGEYVRLSEASFVKSYYGTRIGDSKLIQSKFQLDDTSHHHFEMTIDENMYDKITMTLESMWSNSQNTGNVTASA